GEFLMRVLTALAAPAGAVWLRTQHGNLQLQYQIQMAQAGLDRSEEARTSHDELLRQAVMQARPIFLPPHASAGGAQGQGPAPGNPTDFILLLVPIVMGDQVAGLVEVWQAPDRHPSAIQGFLQFLVHMAELASRFLRNRLLGDMISQQTLWTQLESFARTIHGSLSPVEVAYLIANEGRRLIDCDRVSIGVRTGRRIVVEAISGADVVEKRSNLVQRQRALFEKVIAWGEKLVYTGSKDDSLPPDVLSALDAYLEESNSKLLVVLPLRDEREGEPGKYKKPPRSALMMECFEPAAAPEQLLARTEVIGKHAAGALYNAVEHRRIPFRFIWAPLAKVQEGLGGKTNAIILGIITALLAAAAVLYFVPYPLKMDATGQLLPETRRWVFSPVEAHTEEIPVKPGDQVGEGENLLRMYDVQLNLKIVQLAQEVASAQQEATALEAQYSKAEAKDRPRINQEWETKRATRDAKSRELKALMERTNSVEGRPGEFWLRAPAFPPDVAEGDRHWTILNADFRENLINRAVKPSDPLLRLGHTEGPWEIELKIPQKHIGQVLQAFADQGKDELDVDLLLKSEPTRTYKGKLHRGKIAGEANPNKDENNESEPVVLAWVRIDGDDIPPEDRIPQGAKQRVTGTEVHAKIRCGNHKMGYSLFYGVWEFFFEKVVFFF
ncbi:MAG TPA: efflux RND transporter periplasmic adaptor subunit, partial [Gemmataceae bacterium]|nr:efflux RND transporter periplasmic adaptor subunit [Gemmataceae bacterium]